MKTKSALQNREPLWLSVAKKHCPDMRKYVTQVLAPTTIPDGHFVHPCVHKMADNWRMRERTAIIGYLRLSTHFFSVFEVESSLRLHFLEIRFYVPHLIWILLSGILGWKKCWDIMLSNVFNGIWIVRNFFDMSFEILSLEIFARVHALDYPWVPVCPLLFLLFYYYVR